MVVFIFAVLKAGGQYIPLDGGIIPEETLQYDIADSGARVVICIPKFEAKVRNCIPCAEKPVDILALDSRSQLWATGNTSTPSVEVTPEDGVYVIYTSGTTGKPKGVDVRHGGVTNTLLTEPSSMGITVGSNVAQQLNVGFDMCKSNLTTNESAMY
jgi:non-ribosomal peptide synthetase component F